MQTKLRPYVESTVSGHQSCQHSSHDKHAKGREFSVGQAVLGIYGKGSRCAETVETKDNNTDNATEQEAEDKELPEVAVQQSDVKDTNTQTPE